jgi:hypothetical protein
MGQAAPALLLALQASFLPSQEQTGHVKGSKPSFDPTPEGLLRKSLNSIGAFEARRRELWRLSQAIER